MNGLVYTRIGIAYSDIVNAWIGLKLPAVRINFNETLEPATLRSNWLTGKTKAVQARTAWRKIAGWEFPHTVMKQGEDYCGNTVWVWTGSTIITTGGDVFCDYRRLEPSEQGDCPHLIVEMARSVALRTGTAWQGPDPGWQP